MTTPIDTEADELSTPAQEAAYYVIDPARTKELNRSLAVLLLSRRCPSCKARLETSTEIPSEKAQMKEIAECCSTVEGFIRPEMPIAEIVFRTLLAGRNRPISLENLQHLVTEEWYTPVNPRNITVPGLKRVLDSDTFYGFREVAQETVKKIGEGRAD